MYRVPREIVLPTLKNPEEVLEAMKKGMGWFVVYNEMWSGPSVGYAPATYRRKIIVDPRANAAYLVFSREPREVLATISYILEGEHPRAIVEFRAETPQYKIDEELMARVYGWIPYEGSDDR